MNNQSDYQIYSNSQEAWQAMYQAILNSQKSIYWELYIFVDDEAGQPFFDILEQKARQGLDVKLIVDSAGSFWLSRKRIQSLKKSGVDIRFFYESKKSFLKFWRRITNRDHRKILIIDEEVGFIGGVNIQKHMREWLDIQIKIEGKVVRSLLRSFAKFYILCGGDKKNVHHLLKYKFRTKNNKFNFVFDDADYKKSFARKKYTQALFKARKRVILFSPYYFPDKKFLYALWKARQRGIKIDLLIPFRTDVRIIQYAAYAKFAFLKKIGVNVHLVEKMMHGKGVIKDDDWAMVGSSNLDQSSFYDNYEANLEIKNKKNIQQLKKTILNWIGSAKKLDDFNWKRRGNWQRLKEKIAFKLCQLWHIKKG